MAVMYPTDIENYAYTPSEKEIYTQLKKQLPEKYHVFYSVRWFEVEDGRRVDSESDFIIFDPSFGFITLEVKGGKAIHKDGPQWSLVETVSGETSTRLLKCSPYEQAEKSMRHFYKYFHEEFHQSFNGTYGTGIEKRSGNRSTGQRRIGRSANRQYGCAVPAALCPVTPGQTQQQQYQCEQAAHEQSQG